MGTVTTWVDFVAALKTAPAGSTVVVRGSIANPEAVRPMTITIADGVTIDCGPRWLEGQRAVFAEKFWLPSAHHLTIKGGVFHKGLMADAIDGFSVDGVSAFGSVGARKGRGFSVLNTHISNGSVLCGGVMRATGPEQIFEVRMTGNHLACGVNDGLQIRGGGKYQISGNLIHGLRHEGGAHPDGAQLRAVFGEMADIVVEDNEIIGNAQGLFFENAGGFFNNVTIRRNRIHVGFKRAISMDGGKNLRVSDNDVRSAPCQENRPDYVLTNCTYAEPPTGNLLNGAPRMLA